MVREALGVDLSIGVVQERENIHSPVPDVLEFLKPHLHSFHSFAGQAQAV